MESKKNISPTTPWLNKKGFFKNDYQLKKISQKWDEKTWEDYLSSLEPEQSESLISPYRYDILKEEFPFPWYEIRPDSKRTKNLKKPLHNALHWLSEKQLKIIFFIFFKGLSVRETALRMNISPTGVENLKTRALNSLKKHI